MQRALGGGPRRRWGLLILILCGVVAALGQAPWGLWPLTLIALSVAFAWARPRRALGFRRAFGRGWMLGLGYFAVSLHWIVEPFLVDIARHGWMAPFALILMAAGAAVFWGFGFALAAQIGRGRLSKRGLVLGLTLAEMARSLLFTGFPWALIGHVWIDTPVARLAAFGGPHALTFLTLAVAAVWSTARWRWGRALAVVTVVGLYLGMTPVAVTRDFSGDPIVRIIQPNAPQDLKWAEGHRDQFFANSVQMTGAGTVPDLVVWPETSVPYAIESGSAGLSDIAIAARGAPVVVGGLRREVAFYYNTLSVVGENGQITDSYDKSHLVPFGEYIPFADILARLGASIGLLGPHNGYGAGDGLHLVDIPGVGAAVPLICYEGIFAEEVNAAGDGAQLILLITNDAWFGNYAGPAQHFAQARLRAIEQGLPVVRAANTGISGIIDPYGHVIGQMALNTRGALDLRLPPAIAPPPYTRFGEGSVVLLLGLWALWSIGAGRRKPIDAPRGTA